MAGLYIHIPFCARKCAYCDFPSVAGREGDSGRFFDAVVREGELWGASLAYAEPKERAWTEQITGAGTEHITEAGTEQIKRAGTEQSTRAGTEPGPYCQGADSNSPSVGAGFHPRPPNKIHPCLINSNCSSQGKIRFQTVFIGGGTPSLLPAGELERLMDRLRLLFDLNPTEFTVEANPGTVDRAKLESFRRMGATRISFGVQAAQDGLLKRIGRIHTWEDFVLSYETARSVGFTNVNADMMTGLPGQTVNDAVDTAEKLVKLDVEHVSCYGLILEEGTPLNAAVEAGRESVPDGDREREMFHAAREVLEAACQRRYEITNFAKPGQECLHNLNYWRNDDWLGLGPGAASHFKGLRRENGCDLDTYMIALEQGMPPPAEEHTIGPDEAVFETVMLELRLVDGIDFKRFEARHGFAFLPKYGKQVDGFIESGLMKKTPGGVALTTRGMDLQNTVLMEFML